MDASGHIAIGRLSKATGTNIETIRYGEGWDCCRRQRAARGGYRLYRVDHRKRLNFI